MSKNIYSVLARSTILKRLLVPNHFVCRCGYKTKWAVTRRKNAPSTLALEYFDSTYGNGPYEKLWPSIRLAMLSMPKYCAVVNNFSANKANVEAKLRDLGAVPLEALTKRVRRNVDASSIAAAVVENEVDDEEADVETNVSAAEGVKDDAEMEDESEFMPARKEDVLEEELRRPPPHIALQRSEGHRHPILPNECNIQVPYFLNVYVFPRGDISRFPPPEEDQSGFFDYYLMDAASILPVIALDIHPGDNILDLCAAPGGKSVTMLQTMMPGTLTCNDISGSRVGRLRSVLKQFYPVDRPGSEGKIRITHRDALWYLTDVPFDRVLVDVPCTTDRGSLSDEENNLFTSRRSKERSQMPQVQMDILKVACDCVKIGGTVVYSTCTLSPLQNDGVVHLAIESLKEEEGIEMAVEDTSVFKHVFERIYRFHDSASHYGQTVVPHLPNNFGPSYFVKLKKLKAPDPESRQEANISDKKRRA